MSATPDKATAADIAAAMPAKKSNVTLFLILNTVLLAAVLAVIVLKPGGSSAKAEEHGGGEHGAKAEGGENKSATGMGPTVRLADFIIHLRNPEAERYARISFEIEVGNDVDKERMTAHLPKIREAFIAYLSDQTLEDLRGSEGIRKTKEALFQKLNGIAPESAPRALYVTDLVIQ